MSLPNTAPDRRKLTFGISAAIVILAVLISFQEAPFLDFVDYDDDVISQNPALRGGLTFDAVRFAFTQTPTNLWNPLTYLSHALDFEIFGDWAGGHHLTNILFHIAAALLLLAWLRRHTRENGLALAVTLLFAIHPLRVESVIWISERKDVLSAFFYLLTLTFYSLWTQAPDPRRRRFYLLAVASACLGLLSKPSLMTLPAALLLVDFWPLRRLDLTDLRRLHSLRDRIIEKLPFLAIALIAAVVAWFTWSGNQFIGEPPDLGFMERIGFTSLAYLSYLSRTFFPAGMVAFHPYPPGIEPVLLGIALTLLLLLSVVAFRRRVGSPWLLFGWLWFVGLILPGSGLITISDHFAPDRYTYLAHIGLFAALAWEGVTQGRRFQIPAKFGWILFVGLLLPLVVLTHRQSTVWKNAESLWRHAISVSDRNYVAHNQLGLIFLRDNRFDEGVAELQKAMAANPGFPISIGNLSRAHTNEGNFEEAAHWFLEAGPQLPERARYRDELVEACLAADRTDVAAGLWHKLVEESPDDPAIQLGAAGFFYQHGTTEEAATHYLAATRLDPSNSQASLSLGALLLKSGRIDEAFPLLKQSIANAATPDEEASTRRTLAQAHLLKKEWGPALDQYSEAIKLSPNQALYVNELAQLLLDCPEPSLRDPARALNLATTLPVREGSDGSIPNPRYLRTLARALARNGESTGAEKVAGAGLQIIEVIADTDPLPEPWTRKELESLREGFRRLLPGPES
ncbi:MAG: tetratricopeptide repeat protein [Verrucomicrobiales bacterium]|nr:tetratricopeptide repeat protein [Verrucomicrobiales bacterium]